MCAVRRAFRGDSARTTFLHKGHRVAPQKTLGQSYPFLKPPGGRDTLVTESGVQSHCVMVSCVVHLALVFSFPSSLLLHPWRFLLYGEDCTRSSLLCFGSLGSWQVHITFCSARVSSVHRFLSARLALRQAEEGGQASFSGSRSLDE